MKCEVEDFGGVTTRENYPTLGIPGLAIAKKRSMLRGFEEGTTHQAPAASFTVCFPS